MGFWTIVIQGCGAHHNKDYPKDANVLAEKFVKELQSAGHDIESANFTYSGRDPLLKKET